jgi:hypothetical protein
MGQTRNIEGQWGLMEVPQVARFVVRSVIQFLYLECHDVLSLLDKYHHMNHFAVGISVRE